MDGKALTFGVNIGLRINPAHLDRGDLPKASGQPKMMFPLQRRTSAVRTQERDADALRGEPRGECLDGFHHIRHSLGRVRLERIGKVPPLRIV